MSHREPCRVALAVLCAAGLLSGGCESSGRADARSEGGYVAPVPADPYFELGWRLEWKSLPLVTRGARPKFFDTFDGALLFQDSRNTLTLMEPSTGRNRWSVEVDPPPSRSVGNAYDGERVYAASDNELFVLDARTGEFLERHGLAVVVNTPPLLFGRVAVFGGASGEVLGHSLVSTYKLWGYQLRGAITANPARAGQLAAIISQGGDVITLDPNSGASLGRNRIFGGLSNNPVASDSIVYVASTDQSVYAFDAQSGETVWRHRAQQPIVEQPTLHDGRLYVHIPLRGMVCFDALSGDVLWEAEGVRGRVIALRDRRLIAWDGREAVALDPERGDVVMRRELPGLAMLRVDRFEDGALYAIRPDGWVSRFSPR